MRKIFFFFIIATIAIAAKAQTPVVKNFADSTMPRLCFDLNFMIGTVGQNLSSGGFSANYKNSVNAVTDGLKFTGSSSMGFDFEGGYFFGRKRNYGVGTGIMYLMQKGTATIDKFHIEYQSKDDSGNIFRQSITSNGQIKEDIDIKNINVPVLFKYKRRFSEKLSFNFDAGLLLNMQMSNSYTTNASFNYEAIYAFTVDPETKKVTPIYDNNPTPNKKDILYTEAYFKHTHPEASNQQVIDYFNTLKAHGQNVGLNVSPNTKTGSVSYTQGTMGFIIRPTIGFNLSDYFLVNVGLYYLYQPFKNDMSNGYHLTDNVGNYNSLLNSSSTNTTTSFGGSIGVRYYFVRAQDKDFDHDGIVNKLDRCPDDSGASALRGCPDIDGDGIPDIDDSCKNDPGLAKFRGCADSDGDGIPDIKDACPDQAGPRQFKGCPDKDGDGIPDKDDLCPFQAGLSKFKGCPDTDGDGIPDNIDKCPSVFGTKENGGCPAEEPKEKPAEPVVTKVEVEPATVREIPKDPAKEKPAKETKAEKKARLAKELAEKNAKLAKEKEEKLAQLAKAREEKKAKLAKQKEDRLAKTKIKKEPKAVEPPKEVKMPETEVTGSVRIAAPVLFDINKSTIRESSKPIIKEAIDKINSNPGAVIIVEGYTDTTGPASYNKVLSQIRANVLKKYLIKQGVSEEKIRSVGMGSANPVENNGSRAGRMKNRRAEMKWGK